MQTNFQTTYKTTLKAPVEKVWQALTDPAMVKQYFFETDLHTDWIPGNPIYFRGEYENKMYEDKGIVLEYVPNQKLSYSYLSSWNNLEDKDENYLLISYEVRLVEGGTELSVTQSNYDQERADHSASNWQMVVEGLKKLVEN